MEMNTNPYLIDLRPTSYFNEQYRQKKISEAQFSGPAVNPAANEAIQKAIAYYKEGGGFGKGVEAQLGRAEKQAVASGTQSLVSAGLAGTTMGAGLSKKFQEEVGMPTRAGVEEQRAQALSSLEMAKAQIIQGATEAQRASALQKYLAQLQSSTSFGIASMNQRSPSVSHTPSAAQQPTVQPTPTNTVQKVYDQQTQQSIIPTAYKPSPYADMDYKEMIAAGAVTIT